jgi:hypothetical protein
MCECRKCEVSLNTHDCENRHEYSIRTSCYECGGPACKGCSAIVSLKRFGKTIRARRCNDCAGFYQDKLGNDIMVQRELENVEYAR